MENKDYGHAEVEENRDEYALMWGMCGVSLKKHLSVEKLRSRVAMVLESDVVRDW